MRRRFESCRGREQTCRPARYFRGGGKLHDVRSAISPRKVRGSASGGVDPVRDIDVRGENGYLILPPSLHRSGRRYEIVDDRAPVDAPAWLLDRLEPAEAEPVTAMPTANVDLATVPARVPGTGAALSLRGGVRSDCRARQRFGLLAHPLEPGLHGGLHLLDGATLPCFGEPTLNLLVAKTPRLRPEVIAGAEADDETNTPSHETPSHETTTLAHALALYRAKRSRTHPARRLSSTPSRSSSNAPKRNCRGCLTQSPDRVI